MGLRTHLGRGPSRVRRRDGLRWPAPRRVPGHDEDLVAICQALSHPLRLVIVRAVAASDTPLSPTRLAAGLSQRVPNVAYHVSMLARLGVLELVDTRPGRGGIEHIYRLAAPARQQLERRHVL